MPYKDLEARRRYQKIWMAQRREAWFKINSKCVDCASSEELQLDHQDPALKISHRIWSWSASRREAELEKCVARCRTCHNTKTYNGFENGGRLLSMEDVLAIRRRYALGGITQKQLGSEYGVAQRTVSGIIRHSRWANAEGPIG